MLADFSFMNPLEKLLLPYFKGTTLRGGFGSQFKKIVCIKRDFPECDACAIKKLCAYAYIFETSPPDGSRKLRKIKDLPRPFVIEPPLEGKEIYKEGDDFVFSLMTCPHLLIHIQS